MNTPVKHEENALFPLQRELDSSSEPLVLEWVTEGEDPDALFWIGEVDAVLGYPDGAFPRTFSALAEALVPEDRDVLFDAIQAHLLCDEPYQVHCHARRLDGREVCLTHSGRTERDEDGQPTKFIGTLRLTPPRVQNEDGSLNGLAGAHGLHLDGSSLNGGAPISSEQLARDEQARAQSLLRVAAHLNAQLDLQEVCEAVCEEAGRTLNAPSAVMLFSKARDAFVPTAVRDMPTDYDKRYIPTSRAIYDGHVAQMGTLFLFTDAQTTPDLPNHALYEDVNMRTIGIASLIREGEVLGLLKVYSFGEPRTFNANELALLQGLADQAAQAIANARLLAAS